MKSFNSTRNVSTVMLAVILLCIQGVWAYEDVFFEDGVTAQIDYLHDGSVFIYDATVTMIEPAHILGAVITGNGAVLDIFGGQIDYMLIISTADLSLPDGEITIYGTDFAIDGVSVDPGTTELALQYQTLSGVYEDGTPFSILIDCALSGNSTFYYYQKIKLGWVVTEPDIEIPQSDYSFEQVDIGATQTGFVTVYNQGNAPLSLESLQLTQSEQGQFSMASLEVLPVIVEPNTVIDLEVSFSPVVEGVDTAVLSIYSNDPNDPVVDVVLTGVGISAILPPEEQIVQIQQDYEAAAEDGSIQGVGNGKSANNKVDSFGKMLAAVDELIAAGMYESALLTLEIIESKCDGQKSPADFIQGDAAAELNARVNELIESLQ